MNANPQRPGQKPNHNPKVGLVVDSKIVSNYYFDFYLSSHRGELGTTRPSRYIVLYNDSNFTGDEIHKTTYYLSHLFPRCTKVVRLVNKSKTFFDYIGNFFLYTKLNLLSILKCTTTSPICTFGSKESSILLIHYG